jgi:ABC-type transporter MlaC component
MDNFEKFGKNTPRKVFQEYLGPYTAFIRTAQGVLGQYYRDEGKPSPTDPESSPDAFPCGIRV